MPKRKKTARKTAGRSLWGKVAVYALIAAVAVLLSGCTTTASGKPRIGNVCENGVASGDFTGLWRGWEGVIAAGVLAIFLVSGLVYMLSSVVAHRGLMVWAKNQMYEGFATLILAVFAILLTNFVCSTDVTVLDATCVPDKPAWYDASLMNFCSGTGCFDSETNWGSCRAFDVADYYLQTMRNKINEGFWYINILNMIIAALASTTVATVVSGVGPVISFGHGLSALNQQFSMAMNMVVTAQIMTMTQIWILRIAEKLYVVLLPAGIILRAFGVTRGFGGALIAIAIGFFFIYPLAIVFFYGMALDKVDADLQQMESEDLPGGASADWAGTSSVCFGFVGVLLVGAVLVPFLVFIVLIAFIKGLSSSLGEEVDVSNLTRLI